MRVEIGEKHTRVIEISTKVKGDIRGHIHGFRRIQSCSGSIGSI
jgi:hypothetical protein